MKLLKMKERTARPAEVEELKLITLSTAGRANHGRD